MSTSPWNKKLALFSCEMITFFRTVLPETWAQPQKNSVDLHSNCGDMPQQILGGRVCSVPWREGSRYRVESCTQKRGPDVFLPLGDLSQFIFGPLLFLLSLFIIGIILLQRGKGGGLTGALGGMGGQSAFGVKAGDLFTRITAVAVLLWIFVCALACRWYRPEKLDIEADPGTSSSMSAPLDAGAPSSSPSSEVVTPPASSTIAPSNSTIAPPSPAVEPSSVAPPSVAPPSVEPPSVAPPSVEPPSVEPPNSTASPPGTEPPPPTVKDP